MPLTSKPTPAMCPALVRVVVAASFAALTACSGDEPTRPSVSLPDRDVVAVTLSPNRLTLSGVGETAQLDLVAHNAVGEVVPGVSAVWSSQNPRVASVSATGVVTVVGEGSAEVTALVDDVSGSASVTVEFVWSAIAPGSLHACGLWGRKVYCWGTPTFGEPPARGETDGVPTPTAVDTELTFVELDAGERHTCGLTEAGRMYCWGQNRLGQLGIEEFLEAERPTEVAGDLTFEAMSLGDYHTCGLTAEGAAYCWGGGSIESDGRDLAVGHQPTDSCARGAYFSGRCTRTPRHVNGGLTFVEVSAGAFHTCGLTAPGIAYCWGWNRGMLGNGEDHGQTPEEVPPGFDSPVAVVGGHTFHSVTAGTLHSCGVSAARTVLCWGATFTKPNYGELGGGSFQGSLEPTPVVGLTGVAHVEATKENSIFAANTCALNQAGTAWCWGIDAEGQVGGPSRESCRAGGEMVPCTSTPVPVSGGHSFATLESGMEFACGITRDGAAYCWGLNTSGQLGNGTKASSRTPARVLDPS